MIKSSAICLSLLCVTLVTQVLAEEKMAFAFEVVRHGARAPYTDMDLEFFGVGVGMLTPSGMRQRYLLGRNSRLRYT